MLGYVWFRIFSLASNPLSPTIPLPYHLLLSPRYHLLLRTSEFATVTLTKLDITYALLCSTSLFQTEQQLLSDDLKVRKCDFPVTARSAGFPLKCCCTSPESGHNQAVCRCYPPNWLAPHGTTVLCRAAAAVPPRRG